MTNINKLLNPFDIERYRNILAENKRLKELLDTYSSNYKAIRDINSPNFWNFHIFNYIQKPEELGPMKKDLYRIVSKFFKSKTGKFLDIGFGSLALENRIRNVNQNIEMYGIDISDYAVREARKKKVGKFSKGSILRLRYKSESFDFVVVLEVLEHVLPENIFKALAEIRRVLRPLGTLIVSVPLNEDLEKMVKSGRNPNGHVRVYTKQLIKAELILAGFEVFRETNFYAFRDHYSIKKFILSYLFRNFRRTNDILLFCRKN